MDVKDGIKFVPTQFSEHEWRYIKAAVDNTIEDLYIMCQRAVARYNKAVEEGNKDAHMHEADADDTLRPINYYERLKQKVDSMWRRNIDQDLKHKNINV